MGGGLINKNLFDGNVSFFLIGDEFSWNKR